ncbi:hypothetical protein HPB47_012577 [Ixodes persulcatus]|uniref:Uncharacterized protein n=1 Tax=Ixodes persulcatus TaxID=34615 RepID=A0AC60NT88_IXOPE|nr:hypothetical protein HPB47_012577 [Ixodes persulcatus]
MTRKETRLGPTANGLACPPSPTRVTLRAPPPNDGTPIDEGRRVNRNRTWLCVSLRKALNKKCDELGFRTWCRDDVDANEFFIRLRHLLFVPDDFRLPFAGNLLAARPHQPPLYAARLEQLVRYFTNFWVSHSVVKEIWGQFGNRGPRTKNHNRWLAQRAAQSCRQPQS